MPRPPKHALAFNDRSLRAIKPSQARVDYMDTSPGMRGFGLMVRPSGAKTFFVRYRAGRVERRITVGHYPTLTLADARDLAREVLRSIAVGGDPQADRREKRDAMTFGELAASYLEVRAKRRLRPRSYAEEERVVQHDLLPHWRTLPAAEIRRRNVAQLLQTIVARGADVQANRTRAVVSRVFAYALELEVVEYNPVAGVRRPTDERPRERVLSEDEIRVLWEIWEAEGSITSALFRMLLLTAQREGEVARMRWADLRGTQGDARASGPASHCQARLPNCW
jgi:Arm DNA-binding domain